MTRTREVDRFGNVSYTVRDGDQIVGRILKTTTGYRAEGVSGSWAPAGSVGGAQDWLERYGRAVAR